MKYLKPVDPHVHLRGEEYAGQDYAFKAFQDGMAVGLRFMYEMPNCKPFLIDQATLDERFEKTGWPIEDTEPPIGHGMHIGLTNDAEQVRNAFRMIRREQFHERLRADKTFYTHSTGNMGILDEEYQRAIWGWRSTMNYQGISIGHFEDEKYFVGEFNPQHPPSHSEHQNELAELVQVERQFRNAYDANFLGTFYVAHCSSPSTVAWLEKNKKRASFQVVKEVTWHHMFLNWDDYAIHGNRVKMNPPLRSKKSQERLLDQVLSGQLDLIGTDHAPHPVALKDSDRPPSGIPAILFWPRGIELLRQHGIKEELLADLICRRAIELFQLPFQPEEVEVTYTPSLWDRYGWNPFSRLG